MMPSCRSVLLGLVSVTLLTAQTPPTAPRVEHREVRHGANMIDDYFWLREKVQPRSGPVPGSGERLHRSDDQGPGAVQRRALQGDAGAASSRRTSRCPRRAAAYLYYSRTEEGKQYPIQCRRKGTMEAPEEVLLDLNELGRAKVRRSGRFRGQRRPEPAGLYRRLHWLPPVRSAGEGSAHGRTLPDTDRSRHFGGLGGRQQAPSF